MRDRVYGALGKRKMKHVAVMSKRQKAEVDYENATREALKVLREGSERRKKVEESLIKVVSLTHHSSPAYLMCWCTYTDNNVSACIDTASRRFIVVPEGVTLYMTPPFQFNTEDLEDEHFHKYKPGARVLDREVSKWKSLNDLINAKRDRTRHTIIKLKVCTFTYVSFQAMEEDSSTSSPSSSDAGSPPQSFTNTAGRDNRTKLKDVDVTPADGPVHTLETPEKNKESLVNDEHWKDRLTPEEFLAINDGIDFERRWFDAALKGKRTNILKKMASLEDWYNDDHCIPLMAAIIAIKLYVDFDKEQSAEKHVTFHTNVSRRQAHVQILEQVYQEGYHRDSEELIAYLQRKSAPIMGSPSTGKSQALTRTIALKTSEHVWRLPRFTAEDHKAMHDQTWVKTNFRPWDFQSDYYMFYYQGNNGVVVLDLKDEQTTPFFMVKKDSTPFQPFDQRWLVLFCIKNGMCFAKTPKGTYYAFHPAMQSVDDPNEESHLTFGLRHLVTPRPPVVQVGDQKNALFDFMYGYTVGDLNDESNYNRVRNVKTFSSKYFPGMKLTVSRSA